MNLEGARRVMETTSYETANQYLRFGWNLINQHVVEATADQPAMIKYVLASVRRLEDTRQVIVVTDPREANEYLSLGWKLIDKYVTGPDSPHGGLMRLWKVFYEPIRQSSIIGNLIDIGYENLKHISNDPRDLARHAADAIQFFIPTFKNPDFREESECRLIFTPPPNCPVRSQFRVARGMLVPYFRLKDLAGGAFPEGRLPITGVRIGPSANKALNVESARMLLDQSGYAGIPVDCSNIPYRG